MPTTANLIAFTLATLALVLLPGPGMLFLLARGVGRGRRDAVAAAFGVEAASLVFIAATALGVMAVIASSPLALSVVQYLGATYLVYLAIKALRSRDDLRGQMGADAGPANAWRGFREGFVVGVTNPKVAIFFLAFFPQFISPASGAVATQVLVLGAIFVVLGLAFDIVLAVAAGSLGRWLDRRPRLASNHGLVTGVIYLLLGGSAVLGGGHSS